MTNAKLSKIALGLLVTGGTAIAQPPGEEQPAPPPPAPDSNWAPPLPQEAPPAEQAPATQPPAAQVPTEAPGPNFENVTQPLSPDLEEPDTTKLEIYGFVMLDSGYDFGALNDPAWFDTMRPTKLPAFHNEFGKGTRTFAGVRQTRFGTRATTQTPVGEMDGKFEWELFGVGVDAGQTTLRLRHAYVDWGALRAGQTWSPFMDIDVFPNSIEYWGPNGMPFFRNVQLAWMPIRGESRVTVALERPGASADLGEQQDRIELANVVGHFPAPDVSAEARWGQPWGYIEGAGIMRYMGWSDLDPAPPDLGGHAWGWGFTASSNIKLGPATLKLQATYGHGIENYMNDAGADVAPEDGIPRTTGGIDGDALPVLGLVAFVDMDWSARFTSSAGWSYVWIDNSDGQTPDAFHVGHYALANLLYHPTDKFMLGGEFQFGRRENNSDGFDVNDYRLQFSVRYNFSKTFGGEK